jgi:transposase
MTYPIEYRLKVLSIREKENLTIAEVAERFCVGIASVTRWLKRVTPQMTRVKPATKIDRIALARDVREYPDAYQAERAKRLGVSEKGVGHALRRMNITYKKNAASSKSQRRRTACLPTED